uniref:7TM_GPCR_Srx domain-containing protein n=1 Tax=Strongyloides papillosus TaxID=174720 RepID=A0A0N5CF00_STREA
MNSTAICYLNEFSAFSNSVDSITFISNVTVGLIHFGLTIFFITAQILMFISFHKIPKERYHNTPLPLMRHNGVVSFIQQLCHLVTSIKTIFLMRWKPIIIEIIGGILESAYLCVTVEVCWQAEFFNIYETQLGALIPQIMYIIISGANTTFTLFSVRDIRKSVSGICCSKPIVQVSKLGKAQIKKIKVMF